MGSKARPVDGLGWAVSSRLAVMAPMACPAEGDRAVKAQPACMRL